MKRLLASLTTATLMLGAQLFLPVLGPGLAFAQANVWAVSNIVGLCRGTEIRTGSGLSYPVHTVVPEDGWAVKIIGGPRFADGQTWWDTSRREAGDPSGGTGWVSQQQAGNCPVGGDDDAFLAHASVAVERPVLDQWIAALNDLWGPTNPSP